MVEHPILVRGLCVGRTGAGRPAEGPTVLQRIDQKFLPATIDELSGEEGVATVLRSVAGTRDGRGVLKLFQPVQRTFHLALVEVAWDAVCEPALDPARIESAGLVLRRIAESEQAVARRFTFGSRRVALAESAADDGVMEGWLGDGRTLRGWVRLDGVHGEDADPDLKHRRDPRSAGHAEVDRQIARRLPLAPPLEESVTTLFLMPPAVRAATCRTILCGLVALTSSELSDAPAALTEYDIRNVRAHLHPMLKTGGGVASPSWSQRTLTARQADDADPQLADFLLMLRQLVQELDAFGTSRGSRALFQELNRVRLTFAGESGSRGAGDFLKEAARILIVREGQDDTPEPAVVLPESWPAFDAGQAGDIEEAAKTILTDRLPAITPQEGRFDDGTRRYRLRAFVRIKREDGCPPVTVWSAYSEPFTIAPWYESGDAPPVRISLPDPTDRRFLQSIKPNVAFAVPEGLLGVLNANSPKDFLDGKGKKGGNAGGIDWLCSFNIPIITICAFIVLNIFLSLFDIIFRWMLFIKLCIPIPKRG